MFRHFSLRRIIQSLNFTILLFFCISVQTNAALDMIKYRFSFSVNKVKLNILTPVFAFFRSHGDLAQDAYTHQIIVEKNQVQAVPSVEQLLEMSFVSSDLKFEEVC